MELHAFRRTGARRLTQALEVRTERHRIVAYGFFCYLIKVMEPAVAGDAMLHVACVFGRHQIVGSAFMFVEHVGSFAEYAVMRARAACTQCIHLICTVYSRRRVFNTDVGKYVDVRAQEYGRTSFVCRFVPRYRGTCEGGESVPASIAQLQINPLAPFRAHPAQKYSHSGARASTQRNQR